MATFSFHYNLSLHIILAWISGESQYNKRLEDVRLLKIEISNLISQRNLLTRGLANTADMRQEVLQLNRVLTQERVRARALEQELVSSMNVHRWRKLTGKDPDKMELIVKIQALQKYNSNFIRHLVRFFDLKILGEYFTKLSKPPNVITNWKSNRNCIYHWSNSCKSCPVTPSKIN